MDSAKEPVITSIANKSLKTARSERRIQLQVAKDYDDLPRVPYFDKHDRLIPDHPDLPPEARARLPVLYILRKKRKYKIPEEPPGDTPWYPQFHWETTPTVEEDERPNHILSITTSVPRHE